MRVTGGEAKGRRLKAPRNIRPTQGIVKEAIFNIVAPYIEGATVIDLFAGSGAIGIEALSRGAVQVTFVDREERGLAILRQNLDALGLRQRARVIRADVARWIDASPDDVQAADLIILDPPYGDAVFDRTLLAIDRSASKAIVVAEYSRRQQLPAMSRLQVGRERRYGDTMLAVLHP